jgi:hypothetical protein
MQCREVLKEMEGLGESRLWFPQLSFMIAVLA